MGRNRRANAPTAITDKAANPTQPVNYDSATPKFCLAHIVRGTCCVDCLDQAGRAAFAATLQKLASLTWRDIMQAPRKGSGTEWITRESIRPRIPDRFQDAPKFMALRYAGKLPMVGVRDRDVFHVLWIERVFNDVYDHGS